MSGMRISMLLFVMSLCMLLTVSVFCAEARDITSEVTVTFDGIDSHPLLDRKVSTYAAGEKVTITVESDIELDGIYIKYCGVPENGRLDGEKKLFENGFWTEYIELDKNTATLTFDKAVICEFYVYSEGTLPDDIQRWEVANNETDLMLFAAHPDDDTLYFAGLLPYHTAKENINVKVCFFTTTYQSIFRIQEMLDGVWHSGVKSYPIVLPLPDLYSLDAELTRRQLETRGYPYEAVVSLIRDVLNTYRPQVIVLHDFNGEYGHGAHKFSAATIADIVKNSSFGDFIPSKVYVHLYEQNEIYLPIDEPLEFFGGKSAFNISQEAFRFHISQHWAMFYDWIYGKNEDITLSTEITEHNPARYGLYYSRVGQDTGNEMLENIDTYHEKREKRQAFSELLRDTFIAASIIRALV